MDSDPIKQEFVSLSKAEALPAAELQIVTARDETTVVLLAGPVGCGKTTVIVGLYELFNEGPVAGLLFGGSNTLIGFEQICHSGRVASGGQVPQTVRTNPSSGATFLHLRVADPSVDTGKSASLLVSNITGEAFREVRDFGEPTIVTRDLWRRADVICVILDAERMSVPTKRHAVRSEARTLLRAVKDSQFISEGCRLSLVTSKWDLVASTETETFVGETESELRDAFGSVFASISCHHIAARPTNDRVPFAYGLPELLTEWVVRPGSRTTIALPEFSVESGLSEFARVFWQRRRESLSEVLDGL